MKSLDKKQLLLSSLKVEVSLPRQELDVLIEILIYMCRYRNHISLDVCILF